MASRLGLSLSTVLYHGRVLLRLDQVFCVRSGRSVIFMDQRFAPLRFARQRYSALRRPAKRRLLLLVAASPGITISGAARRLGVNRSTVKRHADALGSMGLIRKASGAFGCRLWLTDPVLRDPEAAWLSNPPAAAPNESTVLQAPMSSHVPKVLGAWGPG